MQPAQKHSNHTGAPHPRPCEAPAAASRIAPAPQKPTSVGLHSPILSCEEIRTIGSWSDVKAKYAAKGYHFDSDEQYLAQAKADWRTIRESLLAAASTAPLPLEFPHESVVINGKRIDIIGIVHSREAHPEYLALLTQRLERYPLLLAEQNLGRENMGLHSNGHEIPDQLARGVLPALVYAERLKVIAIKRRLIRITQMLSSRAKIRDAVGDDFCEPTSQRGERIAEQQNRNRWKDHEISAVSRLMLTLPGDILGDLPAHIDLAYKHERKLPYTMQQARSAFMAEFMRRWDMRRTLEKIDGDAALSAHLRRQVESSLGIVCGQAHQPEIAFFLAHGSREPGVTARAQRTADAFNQDGIEGLERIYYKHLNALQGCGYLLAIAKGIAIGALTSKVLLMMLT
jgi:hypothetical protein